MAVMIPSTTGSYLSTAWSMAAGSDLTLMCWGYLSTTNTGTFRNFVNAAPNTGLSTYSDGLTFDASTQSADYLGQVLSPGVWYHFCETIFSNGNASSHVINGYVNGITEVTALDTSTFSAFTEIVLGVSPATFTNPMSGNMRDVRVWQRVLRADEVVQEMHSARPLHWEAIVGWWPLDDDIFTDRSGNGYILTETGTVALVGGPLQTTWPGRGTNFIR